MDDIDRKIISKLQMDGRTTFEELGKDIGYTSMGVKKRVKKLLEENVIKISALLNVDSLDLCAAIVLLEMDSSESIQRILHRFRDCPRVVHISTTIGGYNLMALVIAEDKNTLESISMEKCSFRSMEGVRRSEFYPISKIHYSPHLPTREHLAHRGMRIAPCGINCRLCSRYQSEKCVGCPSTSYYRGPL